MSKNKFACPMCREYLTSLEGVYDHMIEEHGSQIPEDYTAARFYNFLNTGRKHGSCVMCKRPTEWNEATKKYKRFCNNPACREKYREMFKTRMINKYGKATLLDDPDHQRKMLANRKISGVYKWSDGKSEKTYTGSYELEFLRVLDLFMNFDADDVMSPSPHTYYYYYEGKNRFYIPDFFIPSLGLEIEIKDGNENENKHHKIQEVDKKKEKLKDEVMNTQKNFDYIKIVNKNYDEFFKYLLGKKETARTKRLAAKATTHSQNVVRESYETMIDFLNENYIEPENLFDDILSEGTAMYTDKNKYPIYVVLMHSGTALPNTIKKVTGDEFSHACISFNSKLDPLYSFGRKKLSMLDNGFASNSPKDAFFTKFTAKYAVYVMFVDKIALRKMQDRVKFFIEHDSEFKYDITALIRNFFNQPSENERKYFCSRFVADILNAGVSLDRVPSLYRPNDLNKFANIEKVNEGDNFYNYDYRLTDKAVKCIKLRG